MYFLLLSVALSVVHANITIELNRTICSFCEIILFRPKYDHAHSRFYLNESFSKTIHHNRIEAFLISLVTDTNQSMLDLGDIANYLEESGNNSAREKYSKFSNRKYSTNLASRCSLTLTTLGHLMLSSPSVPILDVQFALYWGLWLANSIQNFLGLINFSPAHVILGIASSAQVDSGDSLEPLRRIDTTRMPPFPTFASVVDHLGNIRGIAGSRTQLLLL